MEGQELAARHISLRERAGLTQEQEATLAGVSPTTISGIESGKIARPHLKTLLKIAQALGADVSELRESEQGKGEALPSQGKLFNNGVLEEERRLRYLRALDYFAAQRNKYWAIRAERNQFSEQQFQEEVHTFSDFEDAFVMGIGIDLLATLRDAGDALPAPERDAFQSAKASLDAWYRTLWSAYDALKARGATDVAQLDEYRAHLERAESGRRSA